MCHKNNFSDKATFLLLSHICALYIFNVSFCQLFFPSRFEESLKISSHICGFYWIPSIPSIRALMVWITTFCSFGCRFKTRETILWTGFLSPSGFFPNNSFASASSTSTSFAKISMDIVACPPSMRLTVLTLIPAFSARVSWDK